MGSLARVLLDLNLLSRWLGTPATWNGFWHPLGTVAKGSAPGAESIDQLQHPTGGVMDTLTRIDVLDFDDTSSAPSDSVDSVDFVSAVTDEPRHHLLSHSLSLIFIGVDRAPLTQGQHLDCDYAVAFIVRRA